MSLDYYNLSGQSIEKTVEYLKRTLGNFHFRWLCACAVYPVLRLPLTVYLGKELAKIVGRSVPDEDEHLSLIRLPWFRDGMMPDEVRLALLRQMSKEDRQKIRSLIEKLMKNPTTAQSDSGEPVVQDWWVPAKRDLGSVFAQLLKGKKGRSEQEDAIFVQYMMGDVPGRLDMKLNNALARYLNIRLRGWVDLRMVSAFSFMVIACVGLWFSSVLLSGVLHKIETYQGPIPQMVRLPGGTFTMGSPENEKGRRNNEGPQRQVTIKPFAVGKHEVTFEEWDACVDDGGCNGYRPRDEGWGRGRRPVINVSWNDAQAYVTWLSRRTGSEYRLLTEAEWEYAARGGTQTRYSFGDDVARICEYANWGDELFKGVIGELTNQCSDGVGIKTNIVGFYKPNPYGLHDVHGNVFEWVQDHSHKNYDGAPVDGSAWGSSSANEVGGRVLRGGTWYAYPQDLRSAYRYFNQPTFRTGIVGFRISRTSFTP